MDHGIWQYDGDKSHIAYAVGDGFTTKIWILIQYKDVVLPV